MYKYCCSKKQVKSVSAFLKHESASAACVFGNSQREEKSRRSEWSFRTAPGLSQDSAAPARSLVQLDTSHRLVPPLWEEQSPCGSWGTAMGSHSCRKPAGWCCPAGRSPRGNPQEMEEQGWEVLSGSAAPWRRCWTGRRWHGTFWTGGEGRNNLLLSLAPCWEERHRWLQSRVRWWWRRLVHSWGSVTETLPGSGWPGTGGEPPHGWWLWRCSSRWLDPEIGGYNY